MFIASAGLVSRFAQPDAIAAISADSHSLSRVLQEGSIQVKPVGRKDALTCYQPIISLAYSKLVEERKSACNAIANLALREQVSCVVLRGNRAKGGPGGGEGRELTGGGEKRGGRRSLPGLLQYQQMVIKEGGVRRLNQLALKEPPQPIDIRQVKDGGQV
eukprot:523600-Hanusia_phi.AAC.3